MEKRFSLEDTGKGVKAIKCSVVSVLTDSEVKRFASKKLRKRINALANDYHLQWAVECDNSTVLLTSRVAMEFNAQDTHSLEMDTTNFLAAINKMEIEDEKVQDQDEERNEDVEFIKEVLKDLEDGDCVALAMLAEIGFGDNSIVLPYGNLSKKLAIKVCKCFIDHNK